MDLDLSDEQRLIQETARDFVDNEIVPRARDNDRAARFDRELAGRLGDMGYLGAPVAEEYGGRGLDYVSYGLIVEEVGRGDSSARTVVSVQTSLVCGSIERWGTEEQKRRWLPRLCSGEALGCFALTEPDAGSDPSAMRTRAELERRRVADQRPEDVDLAGQLRRGGAGLRPDGSRRSATAGSPASWCPPPPRASPLRRSTASSACAPRTPRRSRSTTSRCPEDALLGEVGDGFKIAMTALDSGRYSVAAGCVGICEGCVQASTRYAKERRQFGVPIASFQLVQEMIADMVVRRDAARLLVRRAGILKDQGKPNTAETSIAKLYATESAVECANLAIQVHGGSGYVDDYPVERYLRDARVTTLYEGTSQIQKLIIGREATGINAMTPVSSGR